MNFEDAFTFKDRTQAESFVEDFFDVLEHALILKLLDESLGRAKGQKRTRSRLGI